MSSRRNNFGAEPLANEADAYDLTLMNFELSGPVPAHTPRLSLGPHTESHYCQICLCQPPYQCYTVPNNTRSPNLGSVPDFTIINESNLAACKTPSQTEAKDVDVLTVFDPHPLTDRASFQEIRVSETPDVITKTVLPDDVWGNLHHRLNTDTINNLDYPLVDNSWAALPNQQFSDEHLGRLSMQPFNINSPVHSALHQTNTPIPPRCPAHNGRSFWLGGCHFHCNHEIVKHPACFWHGCPSDVHFAPQEATRGSRSDTMFVAPNELIFDRASPLTHPNGPTSRHYEIAPTRKRGRKKGLQLQVKVGGVAAEES